MGYGLRVMGCMKPFTINRPLSTVNHPLTLVRVSFGSPSVKWALTHVNPKMIRTTTEQTPRGVFV